CTSESNRLQRNSLLNGAGNFSSPSRDFPGTNREISHPRPADSRIRNRSANSVGVCFPTARKPRGAISYFVPELRPDVVCTTINGLEVPVRARTQQTTARLAKRVYDLKDARPPIKCTLGRKPLPRRGGACSDCRISREFELDQAVAKLVD